MEELPKTGRQLWKENFHAEVEYIYKCIYI